METSFPKYTYSNWLFSGLICALSGFVGVLSATVFDEALISLLLTSIILGLALPFSNRKQFKRWWLSAIYMIIGFALAFIITAVAMLFLVKVAGEVDNMTGFSNGLIIVGGLSSVLFCLVSYTFYNLANRQITYSPYSFALILMFLAGLLFFPLAIDRNGLDAFIVSFPILTGSLGIAVSRLHFYHKQS